MILVVGISLILALIFNSDIRLKSFFRGIFFFPAVLGMLVVGLIFNEIFYRVVPVIGKAMNISWLSTNILASKSTAMYGVLIVHVWLAVAMATVMLLAGLQSTPMELYEAAELDGANKWQRFRYITMPFLLPVLSVVLILQIKNGLTVSNAKMMDSKYELGDIVQVPIQSKQFGRIATQNAKNVILQKIREEERKVLYDEYFQKEKDVVTGVVQRYMGKNVSVNLGKVDAILSENEQVKGEVYKPTERIKVYVLEVKDSPKGPKIMVSRTHPELVKRLFEAEVTEVKDGIVEIKSIAREAGSRTKIAVWSNDPDVDAVGACVGMNGARVNTIVEELRGEKIDIISWNENPALLIENALSPAKVITVLADPDEKTALVIVPDYQLSLAIGKEGQNARLAARLTGFKIDIKSETQAREAGDFEYYQESDDEEGEDSMEDALAGVELDEEPKTEEISEETSTEEE